MTARAFPACTRIHANLSFGHYRVAQSLPDGMISEFLSKADRERWPVAKLRLVVHDFQYQQFHPGSRSTPSPESEQDKIITPSVQQEVASALRNQGYGAQEAARVARQTQAADFDTAFREAQQALRPPKAAAHPLKPDSIRALPVSYAIQLKLKALARLYQMPPDALVARIVDHFLESHSADVAAVEQLEADREDEDRRWLAEQHAAQFQREYGMPEQEWRALTAEQQKELQAAADARRAAELQAEMAAREATRRKPLGGQYDSRAADRDDASA